MSNPNPFPNPPTPVEQLMVPMSPDIVLQTIVDIMVAADVRADLWPQEGSLLSAMAATSRVISGGINERIAATKSFWLPTALDAWLEWLALYFYGVFKIHGTFATGALTLTNGGGLTFNIPAFGATFQNQITQKTYQNVDAIALGPGPGTTQTIGVQATEIGTKSNAAPGDVTILVTPMPKVSIYNAGPILGIDDQSDTSLKGTCWNAIAANSPYAAPQAVGYAVNTAKNTTTTPPSPVNVNRYVLSPSNHTGGLTITLASPAGVPTSADVAAVRQNIAKIATPPCVVITVQAASALNIRDTITVYCRATPGLLSSTVQTAAEQALDLFFETYPIGGLSIDGTTNWLFASALTGVLFGAFPGVFDVAGAVDHAMASNQVAVNQVNLKVVLV